MNNVAEEMSHVHKLAKRDPSQRVDHLWELLTDPRWLMHAWDELRSHQGSRTAGIDSTRATDSDPERIQPWSERLNTGRDRPKPGRRVDIANGHGKMRP